jgi:hypothetical protein
MPRTPAATRPSPKAEALGAVKAARKMLDDPLTPFLLAQIGRFLDHAAAQIELVHEGRVRKAKDAKPARPAVEAVAR